MSESKHSPNWELNISRPQYHGLCYEVRNPFDHLDDNAEDFDERCKEVEDANTNLIHAAPDLLAALKQILGWRELRSGAGEFPVERIEEIARSAIAKATTD